MIWFRIVAWEFAGPRAEGLGRLVVAIWILAFVKSVACVDGVAGFGQLGGWVRGCAGIDEAVRCFDH
jgi:hypothetical protein